MLLVACSRGTPPAATQPSNTVENVLLITIDSLRADHVGAYGDAEAHTPALDALAAGGVRFDRAYASTPLTLPSHTSLLTGRYPPHHGVRTDAGHLGEAVPTLAETFRHGGFATAAFPAATPLDGRSGLARGFESYATVKRDLFEGRPATEVPERVVVDAADWLETHAHRRFFMWVHVFAPHVPYGNPGDRARAARPAIDRYDDEVMQADAQVGRLLAALGPGRRNTLIVVTADHGEAFGEHGEITHGLFVYDATLRVPLILNGPAIARGRVISDPVSLVDVAPTLVALAGLGRFDADGVAVLPTKEETPSAPRNPRLIYSESYAPLADFGWSPLRSARRGDWKYIAAPEPELYDVRSDPGETRNLVEDQPARATELAHEIDTMAPLDATGGPARPDPKDRREIAARLAEVTSGELQGPLLERALREIIRDDPGNGVANLRLAELLAGSRRCKEAVKRFRLAVAAHAPGADTSASRARCQ